ncbi:MAG: DUF4347 domain-containing protein [Myxacorys californica WJT36-NPBG1]|jgi:major membrane immunogen (membrane-anchored lipoprotein)|nr:DUF4347 domain-containing protein [Myxacorys californica WJT36-NPBG1]
MELTGSSIWSRSPFVLSTDDVERTLEATASPLQTPQTRLARSAPASILFIESGVKDYQSLVTGVQAGTEVHVLHSAQNASEEASGAIAQITQTLLGRSGISSLHIISHGEAGKVQLGSTWLTGETLSNYASQFKSWSEALTEDADILLYGCDIAQGQQGQAFLNQFGQLTGADIAASTNWTGNAELGGDWTLEVNTGEIEAPIALRSGTLAAYQGVLPIDLISVSNPTLFSASVGGSSGASSTSQDGQYVVFTSSANNLVDNDTNGKSDVFLFNRTDGSVKLISHQAGSTFSATGDSINPIISSNGDFVTFVSNASNLVSGNIQNTFNRQNIFVWDRQNNATTLVSRSTTGLSGDNTSSNQTISSTGDAIAFLSQATNLDPRDGNTRRDAYLWTKSDNKVTLISRDFNRTNVGDGIVSAAVLSSDGGYVAFASTSSNLIANDPDKFQSPDVFLWKRPDDGSTDNSVLLGLTSGGNVSGTPSISIGGDRVAFTSNSPLGTNDTNGLNDVFVWTRSTTDPTKGTIQLVSANSAGQSGTTPNSVTGDGSFRPVMNDTGTYVAFTSTANDLVGDDTNAKKDVFLRDLTLNTTVLVNRSTAGTAGDGDSDFATLSYNGKRVSFISNATNLVNGDTNGKPDIFVRDISATPSTYLISRTPTPASTVGNNASGSTTINGLSTQVAPVISGDGSFVTFNSAATDLIINDSNNLEDVFVTGVSFGSAVLATRRNTGSLGNSKTGSGDSNTHVGSVSADGRYVVFTSKASELAADDTNAAEDVFLRDLQTGETTLISRNHTGTASANAASFAPQISADGQYIVFSSTASNITVNDSNTVSDVFWYDRKTNKMVLVSHTIAGVAGNGASLSPVLSTDGLFVAFVSSAPNLTDVTTSGKNIFIWNSATDTTTLVSGNAGGNGDSDSPVINGNGEYVVFTSAASNLVGGDTNNKKDIFVWNRSTNAIALVSQSSGGAIGNGDSSVASISNDGKIIAFTSVASNLGGGTDSNNGLDIFIRNLNTNTTTLVSANTSGTYSAGGGDALNRFGAFNPMVSGNGEFVAFSSTFIDLTNNDSNNAEDVFVRNFKDNTTQLVSINSSGASGTGTSNGSTGSSGTGSSNPVISSDGRFIGFSSYSTDLVSGDTNGVQDIFVRDSKTASTTWISRTDTAGGNGASFNPVINSTGSYLAFASNASNLTGSDLNGKPDVFGSTLATIVSLSATNKSVAESGALANPTYQIRRSRTEGTLTIKLKIDATSTATIAATVGARADFTPTIDAGSFTITGSDLIITLPDGVGTVNLTLTPQDDIQAEAAEFVKLTLAVDPAYSISTTANTDTVTIEANDTVVTSINDSGEGSLRQAILNANAFSGKDTISFKIEGSGVKTISLASALPDITDAVIIDGTTQEGYTNTPIVELNGAGAENSNGLTITSGDSTVKGLVINRFSQNGIRLEGTGSNTIEGNRIGTDAAGNGSFGNASDGISINSSNNIIGGTIGNVIANNQGSGITVEGNAIGNRIQKNAIFLNSGLGIDLGKDGVTPNDAGDADSGANGLQNTAVLTIAEPSSTSTAIFGTFDGAADSTFQVEFFSNTTADPSGFGEGQTFLGTTTITTDATGKAIVSYTHPQAIAAGQFISATITDATGNTSEFSNSRAVAVPKVTISPTTLEQLEGEGTTYVFTLNLDQASSQEVSVQVTTADITATSPSDYEAFNQTVTFAAGETSKTVSITAKGDTAKEPNETFRVSLNTPMNAVLGSDSSAIATILDDDNPPTLSIVNVTPTTVSEGDTATTDYQFEVKLSNATSDPVTVTYATADGSATTSDNDYTTTSQMLTFAAGETSKIITVSGTGDTKFEQDETFTVTLSNVSSNASIATATAIGTIKNDDQGSVISVSAATAIDEGAEGTTTDYVFTVSLDKPSGETVTVKYSTEDLTAKASDNDYEPITNTLTNTLTFAPNTTTQTVVVKVKGDRTSESDEQFKLVLSEPTNGAISVEQGSAIATIKNDDLHPTVQITAPNKVEGDTTNPFNFLISLSHPSDTAITVNYTTENGTALAGEDYTAQIDQTLTFNPGETEKTIAVDVLGDRKREENETFSIKLTNATNATLANANGVSAVATIQNDDLPPEIAIANITQNQLEGAIGETNANTFEVSLSNPSAQIITVKYDALNGNLPSGNATLENNDFEAASGILTFNPGETKKAITVNVKGDTDQEPDETYLVKLSNVSSSATLKTDTAQGLIRNDDAAPTISILGASIDEGNSGQTALKFKVNLSSASTDPITVSYSTGDGSAKTSDNDYASVSNASITFAPGETLKEITILLNGDTKLEPDEDFKVTLTSPINATIASAIAAGTITNDDRRPTLGISGVTKGEGNSGTQDYVFTVALSNESAEVITVDYATQDDTATVADGDYIATTGQLTFSPGGSLEQTITVQTTGDVKFEPTEKFIVKLLDQSVVNADISVNQADGVLTNDDNQPTLSLSGRQSQNEGNSETTPFTFEVALSNPSSDAITVDYTTIPGSSTPDVDYIPASGTLTFNPGDQKKTITVLAKGDTDVEPDEDFTLRLSNAVKATLPAGATDAQGIIQNDDQPPFPTISIDDASSNEGNTGTTTPLTFKVKLSQATTVPVTVQYATSDGTAKTDDGDYTGVTTTTLTFAPNETEKDVTVLVNGDSKFEPNEILNVTLVNPTNAQLSAIASQAKGVITNDDAKPTLSINAIALTEGDAGLKDFVFAVDLSNPTADTVEVDYDTLDGTARLLDSDYQRAAGKLTFLPGDPLRQFITVKVVGDRTFEPTETFTIGLKDPKNADLSAVSNQGTGTILADDFRPTFSIQNVTAPEGNSATTPFTFKVDLSNPSSETITVQYDTKSGTADTSDYTQSTGTLTFAPSEQSKTITVQVTGDTQYEPDETFTVELSNPANATLPPSSATGTIQNDEPLPQVQVSASPSQQEGNSGIAPFVFEVSLSQASSLPITVSYTTADGQATTADNDYTSATGTLTFNPGETKKTVTVNVLGDTRFEANETFQFNLSNPTNATLSNQGTGTILADDLRPTFSIQNVTVPEGSNSGTTPFTFKVDLSNPSSETITVQYDTKPGTADISDYMGNTGTLTFAPLEQSKTITVPVTGDAQYELDETFTVELSNPTNALLPSASSTLAATGTIQNDDSLPQVQVSVSPSQAEGNSGITPFVFEVSLSQASSLPVTVSYTTADGQATIANNDYTSTTGTLTFNPGETKKTVTVNVLGDTRFEPNETFQLKLSNPSNATLSTVSNQGTGTILADDLRPTFSIQNVTAPEGNSATTPFTFKVDLSNPSSETITVQYDTKPGTADAADYTRNTGTLTFAPSEQSKTITVPVTGDTQYEPDETFTVELSNPTNATLPSPSSTLVATGTIQNDDSLPQVQVSATPSREEGNSGITPFVFEVSLSQASSLPVTVSYTTADGQATIANNDYTSTTGRLTFNPGETKKTVTVNVLGDTRPEANETFQFKLSNPSNATIAPGSEEVNGTIENDDTSPSTQINRDSKTDIVWRNALTGENAIWYLNNTTYESSSNLPTVDEEGWRIKATADLDGDGDDDLIWQNERTSSVGLWLMEGNQAITYAIPPLVPGTDWKIQGAADFNRDRKADIIWRNTRTGENAIWLMNGTTLSSSVYLPSVLDLSWKMQQFGDFNNDSDTDILWRNESNGEVAIWQLQTTQFKAGYYLPTIADLAWKIKGVADFTGDTFLDIVWQNDVSQQAAIWQTRNFAFEQGSFIKTLPGSGWEIQRTKDLNGDFNPDLLWHNYLTGQNAVWYMNRTNVGTGLYLPRLDDLLWDSFLVGDFDKNRTQEVLLHNNATGATMIWQLNSSLFSSNLPLATVSDTNWVIDLSGDFTRDGEADLLWRNVRTGEAGLWLMKNGARYANGFGVQFGDPAWVAEGTADFNGDRNLDLVWRNHRTGEVALWKMDGVFISEGIYLPRVADLDWEIEGVQDFNRDRSPDLLWRNRRTGETGIWLMDGFQFNRSVPLQTVSNEWRIKGVGDFNANGQPDLLWRNESTGEVAVWLMNDTQFQQAHYLPTVGDAAWDIYSIRDFSEDGSVDLLWQNSRTGETAIWFLIGVDFGISMYLPTYTDKNWHIEAVDDFKMDRQ